MHIHEVRPRKDHRGGDLISDALPFGGSLDRLPSGRQVMSNVACQVLTL